MSLVKFSKDRRWCSICWEVETALPDGICSACENESNVDLLLKRFALPNPVRFPFPKHTVLPCMADPWLYDRHVLTIRVREMCGSCPARDWCLEQALANPKHCVGIWGGTTHDQRLEMLREKNDSDDGSSGVAVDAGTAEGSPDYLGSSAA